MASKIKQGDYVKHYSESREIFKAIYVDQHFIGLIDADSRHFGTFPIDECERVQKHKRVITVKKWVVK